MRRALWPGCSEAMHALEMQEYKDHADTRSVLVVDAGSTRLGGFIELASDAELDNEDGIRAHEALGFKATFRLIHFLKPVNRR